MLSTQDGASTHSKATNDDDNNNNLFNVQPLTVKVKNQPNTSWAFYIVLAAFEPSSWPFGLTLKLNVLTETETKLNSLADPATEASFYFSSSKA